VVELKRKIYSAFQ